jgi:hypothetical protein
MNAADTGAATTIRVIRAPTRTGRGAAHSAAASMDRASCRTTVRTRAQATFRRTLGTPAAIKRATEGTIVAEV